MENFYGNERKWFYEGVKDKDKIGNYTKLETIETALGVTIGVGIEQDISYEIDIPAGERRQIIYRPYFKTIKVVEKEYFVDHGMSSPTGRSKTSYVKVFIKWDFSWRSL